MASPDLSSLVGKTALVTGGSKGIGAAIAFQFARKGITGLAVTYATDKGAAEEVLVKCRELGVKKTIAIQADLLDPEIGPNVVSKVLAGLETKSVDVLVNNAALMDFSLLEPFEHITLNGVAKGMQAHVFGLISLIQATLPHLPPKGGRIINISSIRSKTANMDPMLVYGASKAAVDSITRSLAAIYGTKTGATFNSVSVGATLTDAMKAVMAGAPAMMEQAKTEATAENRVGMPEDVALIVGFLASEEARWINGAHVPANGGNRELLALQG